MRWLQAPRASAECVRVDLLGHEERPEAPLDEAFDVSVRLRGSYVQGARVEGGFRYRLNKPDAWFEECTGMVEAVQLSTLGLLSHEGGVAMHACVFRVGDGAALVAGAPDAGKSTLYERTKDGRLVDEIALVAPDASGWAWWRIVHLWTLPNEQPATVPLRAVGFLSPRRDRTAARRTDPREALRRLIPQMYWLDANQFAAPFLDSLGGLVEEVPTFELDHSLDAPIEAVYEAIEALR